MKGHAKDTAGCWKPSCRAAATVELAGDGWVIHSCAAHEPTARAVVGTPPTQTVLYEGSGGGGVV